MFKINTKETNPKQSQLSQNYGKHKIRINSRLVGPLVSFLGAYQSKIRVLKMGEI